MRVVAGKAKGTPLKSVPGNGTRPILDRVKTALFDILRPEIEGYQVLDLFAGSGAVGIEALSQGATSCIFIDLNKKATETIKENLEKAKLSGHAQVRNTDAFTYLRNTSKTFDLIYIAPPQYQSIWIEALQTIAERPEVVAANGLVITQIDPKEYESLSLAEFKEIDSRTYGNTKLVLYRKLS